MQIDPELIMRLHNDFLVAFNRTHSWNRLERILFKLGINFNELEKLVQKIQNNNLVIDSNKKVAGNWIYQEIKLI